VADVASPDYSKLVDQMHTLASRVLEKAPELELLFITNIWDGDLADFGPNGLLNAGQYYSRRQADEIIRTFQDLGLTVTPFFDELSFFQSVTDQERDSGRLRVVYTTAEGGTGSGRRALIPAMCSFLGLPVLNSGAHACSLARHKFHANAVLRRLGVRVPEAWKFADGGWAGGYCPPIGSRVIVKPMWESQSIGVADDSVQVVDSSFEVFLIERSRRFGQPVLVQKFVSGDEIGVSIIQIGPSRALPPMAFRQADGRLFDKRPKTFRDEALERNVSHVPLDAPAPLATRLSEAAVRAFDALEMRGVGRIDFRVDADGRPWAFDTNESPPPLRRTSYAAAMEHLGFPLEEMLAVWLGVCLVDYGILSGV
jgi:D-alanine-D-alanine ligase